MNCLDVRCVRNQFVLATDWHRSIGYTEQSRFPVTAGLSYRVYAMCVWRGLPMFMCRADGTNRPSWFPFELFEPLQASIPDHWLFRSDPSVEYLTAIWGYEALVVDKTHNDRLLEREPDALLQFEEANLEYDQASG